VITSDLIVLRHVDNGPSAPVVASPTPEPAGTSVPSIVPFSEAERRAIIKALELTGWRISGRGGAAEILGLKPTTLHAKMKKLGIQRPSGVSVGPA
jgi:transcriptional regulator with GAF, ATPase, and Fis domain